MFHQDATSVEQIDPELFRIIGLEKGRQEQGLELIASENYCSLAVMEAQGAVLTNKYAEGYPGKRYYGGCEFVDLAESLAIKRACELFGCNYANVQPHSGSQANMAVYLAALEVGDKVLGMSLNEGGHLTHGHPANFSGKLFNIATYGLHRETERLDYDSIKEIAKRERPKMIIAGASSYPRAIDFEAFGQIAKEIGALLFVDMAHIAGLVATGHHQSPVDYADLVTSTTHKTLRGPRGGIILSKKGEVWAKKINSTVFPGIQGGPLEHVIAAKAVALQEALMPEFKDYQGQVIANAKALAETLLEGGLQLVSGGTDNHLILCKTHGLELSGKEAEQLLERVGITCNKNMIPQDTRSPFVTSGIRLGTPAMTTRGLKQEHMKVIGKWIVDTLKSPQDSGLHEKIKSQVQEICRSFPVYSR